MRAILIALIIVCVVAFAIYNVSPGQTVAVNLIWARYVDVPVITVVFWSFAVGVFVSLLIFVFAYIRLSVRLRAAHRHVKALETEVTVLRNRPIEESANALVDSDRSESPGDTTVDQSELR
ncbi:MAG: LapA family protein [Candidatus Zixiibacteriota bacterium]